LSSPWGLSFPLTEIQFKAKKDWISHGLNGLNGLGAFKGKLLAPNPFNPFKSWLKIGERKRYGEQ
jgi:hypothetical protein